MPEIFEWDDAKAEANFLKHGIDFRMAATAFEDAFGLYDLDLSMDYGEHRFQLNAKTGGKLVTVIYTERKYSIRIISDRLAMRREHDRYYRENAQG